MNAPTKTKNKNKTEKGTTAEGSGCTRDNIVDVPRWLSSLVIKACDLHDWATCDEGERHCYTLPLHSYCLALALAIRVGIKFSKYITKEFLMKNSRQLGCRTW